MTAFSLASCRWTLRFGIVTTRNEDRQFEAAEEAFFNAAYDDAPLSERPVTLELEAEEAEIDEGPVDPVASERLRARRARLTQGVTEIVATLAVLSGTAFGMHLVRGLPAASPRAAAATSPAPEHAAPVSTAVADVTPAEASFSAHVPASDRGEMPSVDQPAIPSGSGDALEPSERSHRVSGTRRARPAPADSAARLRVALRRYRTPAGDRTTPGS
jgi:hypothetical protein